jgi:hypothetical protein
MSNYNIQHTRATKKSAAESPPIIPATGMNAGPQPERQPNES